MVRPSSGRAPSTSNVFAVTSPTPTRTGSPSPVRFCWPVPQAATADSVRLWVAVVDHLLIRQPGLVEAHPAAPDQHAAIRFGIRQRGQQHGADHAEDGRGRADAQRQGDEGGDGEPGAPPQAAQAGPEVLQQGVHALVGRTGAPRRLRIIGGMPSATAPPLSSLVRAQMSSPSPIRQIMKMAERQNILAMGLDPDAGDFVRRRLGESRGAGGVPAGLSATIVNDPALFHKSGGYTATLGDLECREQIARFEAHLFGVPRLGAEHIAIGMGSTQLTHDLFRTLRRSGRHGDAARSDLRQLRGTARLRGARRHASCGCAVIDPATWAYLPDTDPEGVAREFRRLFDPHKPDARAVRRARQPDQPDRAAGAGRGDAASARAMPAPGWPSTSPTSASTSAPYPAYYAWSPADHPHVIGIHSNSKWARGLGRRLGWIEAAPARRRGDRARAAVQHPVPRHARADGDGALSEAWRFRADRCQRYVDYANALYKKAAKVTLDAIDTYLQRPRLVPRRRALHGAWTSAPTPRPSCPRRSRPPACWSCPAAASARRITNGVRISFGPLVNDTAKITEGIKRLAAFLSS